MKLINAAFFAILLLTLTSCAVSPPIYYQVYKTQNTIPLAKKDNKLSYEDGNCKVSYDLWEKGGDAGFVFYNKSEKDIYLNLEESYFILNGTAHNYYQNRVTTYSINAGATTSKNAQKSKIVTGINPFDQIQSNSISLTSSIATTASAEVSTAYTEEKIVCIPSNSSKIIKEFEVNQSLFRDPDLFKYPSKKQVKPKAFAKTNSPFVFSNRLTYSVGKDGGPIKFENDFFVSEITNYPEREISEMVYEEFAGQKGLTPYNRLKNPSPDKFFIMYRDTGDHWKH